MGNVRIPHLNLFVELYHAQSDGLAAACQDKGAAGDLGGMPITVLIMKPAVV